MGEYNDAVESSLVEEEQTIAAAEENGHDDNKRRLAVMVSTYIAIVSLLVAVAAMLTAFAADAWMTDTLEGLSDKVDRNSLRIELRSFILQQQLASHHGQELDAETQERMKKTERDLNQVELELAEARQASHISDKAHYIMAFGITMFQLATAIAAVVGITGRRRLFHVSVSFSIVGLIVTVFGVMVFLR